MNQIKKGTDLGVFAINGEAQKLIGVITCNYDIEFDGLAIAPLIQEEEKNPPKYDEPVTGNLI